MLIFLFKHKSYLQYEHNSGFCRAKGLGRVRGKDFAKIQQSDHNHFFKLMGKFSEEIKTFLKHLIGGGSRGQRWRRKSK